MFTFALGVPIVFCELFVFIVMFPSVDYRPFFPVAVSSLNSRANRLRM